MATPKELRSVEEAHRAAQARLGLAGAYLVLRDWGSEGTDVRSTATGWISPALRVINALRRKSMKLARRYYRLARAIETGSTLGFPESMREGRTVTMKVLRDEYLDILNEIAGLGTEPSDTDDPDEQFFEQELSKTNPEADAEDIRRAELLGAVDLPSYIEEWEADLSRPDGEFITIDPYDWDEDDEDAEEVAEVFERAIRDNVVSIGDRRIQEIRQSEATADSALSQVQEQHAATGSRAAGRVDRYGIAAGRSGIDRAIERDRKVKLVARGLGPNPCAFCAMLASRGFVFKSKMSAVTAGGDDDIRRYHDNCHCYPIVRWVDASELPAANAWLQDQWYVVTRGTSGAQARAVWRRWFDKEGRELLGKQVETAVSQSA